MGISRGRFLGTAAAVGGAVVMSAASAAAASSRNGPRGQGAEAHDAGAPGTRQAGVRRGLAHRGTVYEVGEGEIPATAWSPGRMRADLRAIRHDLHANSVKITGSGVERLTSTAAEAAERGLRVWLEPTLGDVPEKDILDHLAQTGRFAERLRRQGADVHLSVGCEFWLFVPGIVPGADVLERIDNLVKGNFDPERMLRLLRRFTARAAAVGRSVFKGRLTYAAAEDEALEWTDWDLFDLVGLDYYGYRTSHADYVRDVRRFVRPGKPLAVMEFGCCTFDGAPELGGMGWDVVDYTKTPPEIKGGLVRSERTQAAYVSDVLAAFEALNLYAAHAFTFVTADAPHRPDSPLHDLDMASYALVKPLRDRPEDPETGWHWEPKQAFHALARAYGRASSRPCRSRLG
jgi:hypothetical protein